MTQPDRLTYDEATPEQVDAARDRARTRIAAARSRYGVDYWARLRQNLNLPARTG